MSKTPWIELEPRVQQVLLYGSGEDQIEFRYKEGAGTARKRHAFEGIVPNLERRFRETDSQAVRDELQEIPRYAGPASPAAARA